MISELYKYDENIRKEYGIKLIAGSDEVGRGAMAGPIVVASVILKPEFHHKDINDSKKVPLHKREELYDIIIENCISYSIKEYDAKRVDELNPKVASVLGMKEGILDLTPSPEICLIDGEKIELNNLKTIQIIKGDATSMTIAAASIIAKVYRDRMMIQYEKQYPGYGFEKHVGYCTKLHIEKVKELGVLNIHRKSYKPIKDILEEK